MPRANQSALELFAALYAENRDPIYLRNIGRCHQKMRQPVKAIDAFEEYLRRSPRLKTSEKQEIESFVKDMKELKAAQDATSRRPSPHARRPPTPRLREPAPRAERRPASTSIRSSRRHLIRWSSTSPLTAGRVDAADQAVVVLDGRWRRGRADDRGHHPGHSWRRRGTARLRRARMSLMMQRLWLTAVALIALSACTPTKEALLQIDVEVALEVPPVASIHFSVTGRPDLKPRDYGKDPRPNVLNFGYYVAASGTLEVLAQALQRRRLHNRRGAQDDRRHRGGREDACRDAQDHGASGPGLHGRRRCRRKDGCAERRRSLRCSRRRPRRGRRRAAQAGARRGLHGRRPVRARALRGQRLLREHLPRNLRVVRRGRPEGHVCGGDGRAARYGAAPVCRQRHRLRRHVRRGQSDVVRLSGREDGVRAGAVHERDGRRHTQLRPRRRLPRGPGRRLRQRDVRVRDQVHQRLRLGQRRRRLPGDALLQRRRRVRAQGHERRRVQHGRPLHVRKLHRRPLLHGDLRGLSGLHRHGRHLRAHHGPRRSRELRRRSHLRRERRVQDTTRQDVHDGRGVLGRELRRRPLLQQRGVRHVRGVHRRRRRLRARHRATKAAFLGDAASPTRSSSGWRSCSSWSARRS